MEKVKEEQGKDGRGAFQFPWAGSAVGLVLVVLMAVVSWTHWAELPRMVPSGKVDLAGEPTLTPRWLYASAAPSVMVLLMVILSIGLPIAARFQRELTMPVFWSAKGARALLDLFLVLMGGFVLVIHTVMLRAEAGRELPLSTDHMMVLFVAAFLVGMGLLVPLLRAKADYDTLSARWWDRARWPVGIAVALVGVLCAAVGFLASEPMLAAYLVGLMLPAILIGCAVPFVGNQEWKNKTRSVV
ncbi:hypothetical protein [Nocardiopsis oceani]